MLISSMDKNKKIFRANQQHPLFEDIQSIVKKSMGLDQLLEKVEKLIKRKVKCFILRDEEETEYLTRFPEALLLWEK